MAGLVLMPYLCLLCEDFWAKKTAIPRVTVGCLVGFCLLATSVTVYGRISSQMNKFAPPLEFNGFTQSLKPDHPLSRPTTIIREMTARDAILLAGDDELHLPTITQRALYVPYNPERRHVGYLFSNEYVVQNVKGIPADIEHNRRRHIVSLFEGRDETDWLPALNSIAELSRDLVILADKHHQSELIEWLSNFPVAREIYVDAAYSVTLLDIGRTQQYMQDFPSTDRLN